jgi:phosphomannomutase
MGCQVVDVGTVSPPCFWFAVEHLEAAGGTYVTGHGCGPAGIGLDFLEGPGVAWSRGGSLDRLEAARSDRRRRTSRQAGGQRTFRARIPYEAGLLKHFHALRPLRIGLACLASTVDVHLAELLAAQACRVERVASPIANDSSRSVALALERLADRVRDDRLEAGVLLGDDGQSCRVLDERGVPIATEAIAVRLGERVLEESKSRTVVLDESRGGGGGLSDRLARSGGNVVPSGGSREAMARSVLSESAAFGCDAADRYWFGDAVPRCDGLTTLARVLQLLSRSDEPASSLRGV